MADLDDDLQQFCSTCCPTSMEKASLDSQNYLQSEIRSADQGDEDEAARHSLGSHPISGKPLRKALCAKCWRLQPCGHLTCCPAEAAASTCCAHCKLVQYCSFQCMQDHRESHRQLCESHLLSRKTSPFLRKMDPRLLPDTPISKYAHLPTLSNPSFPVYGLLENAGDDYKRLVSRYSSSQRLREILPSPYSPTELPDNLHFLFPCVYDLRNVLQTVCQVPDRYRGTVIIFMNSAKSILAVRDVLILELLRCYGPDGIDIAIALWYSSALKPQQDRAILLAIRRILRGNRSENIKADPKSGAKKICSYRSSFPSSRKGSFLQADFSPDPRAILVGMLKDLNERFEPRSQYWERDEETDDIENVKRMCAMPAHLASWNRYHTHGLLLPFDTMDTQFTVPNRLRYCRSLKFIARYSNDALCGWDIVKVISSGVRYGACDQDLYGCLFFHIREMMQTFLQKLKGCCIELHLTQFSPKKLAEILYEAEISFHRIDACSLAHESTIDQGISTNPDNAVRKLPGVHVLLEKLSILGEKQKSRCSCTLPETVQSLGRLLEKDASKEFPSLLLTAMLDWATKEPSAMDFLKEEERKTKTKQARDRQEYADLRWQNHVYSAKLTGGQDRKKVITTLLRLYAPARALMYFDGLDTGLRFDKEYVLPYWKRIIVEEEVEQKTGLENKTETNSCRILPRNWYQLMIWRNFFRCTSNVANAPEDAGSLKEAIQRAHPSQFYYTVLFSGFTFLENFQEWGWLPPKDFHKQKQ